MSLSSKANDHPRMSQGPATGLWHAIGWKKSSSALIATIIVSMGAASSTLAQNIDVSGADATGTAARTAVMSGDLSDKTDTELTELTAQWGKLSPGERRKLLAEVTGRMAASRKVRPPVGVRVQRRYGRVVRKSDGSVVVQTRVVQVRPSSVQPTEESVQVVNAQSSKPRAEVRSRVTFGIGFERRSSMPATESSAPASPPVVTVSQSQNSDSKVRKDR